VYPHVCALCDHTSLSFRLLDCQAEICTLRADNVALHIEIGTLRADKFALHQRLIGDPLDIRTMTALLRQRLIGAPLDSPTMSAIHALNALNEINALRQRLIGAPLDIPNMADLPALNALNDKTAAAEVHTTAEAAGAETAADLAAKAGLSGTTLEAEDNEAFEAEEGDLETPPRPRLLTPPRPKRKASAD
jgi:hypothetical protein